MLLFFPCVFVLIEIPTEAKILKRWSTSMFWKIEAEIPEYRELGVWYIRRPYAGLSDREVIAALESRFERIDFAAIRNKYNQQLENIRADQFRVIAEATGVYLSVITFLHANFRLVAWVVRKIRFSRAAR
jgi:hypothetical protein